MTNIRRDHRNEEKSNRKSKYKIMKKKQKKPNFKICY